MGKRKPKTLFILERLRKRLQADPTLSNDQLLSIPGCHGNLIREIRDELGIPPPRRKLLSRDDVREGAKRAGLEPLDREGNRELIFGSYKKRMLMRESVKS